MTEFCIRAKFISPHYKDDTKIIRTFAGKPCIFMTTPEIAIVAPNTLTSLGLQNLLEEIIPMATIRVFRSFAELMDDTPDMYAHYFISSRIYFEHTSFFLPRKPKTIVLAGGDNQPQLSGVPTQRAHQQRDCRQTEHQPHHRHHPPQEHRGEAGHQVRIGTDHLRRDARLH